VAKDTARVCPSGLNTAGLSVIFLIPEVFLRLGAVFVKAASFETAEGPGKTGLNSGIIAEYK